MPNKTNLARMLKAKASVDTRHANVNVASVVSPRAWNTNNPVVRNIIVKFSSRAQNTNSSSRSVARSLDRSTIGMHNRQLVIIERKAAPRNSVECYAAQYSKNSIPQILMRIKRKIRLGLRGKAQRHAICWMRVVLSSR